MPGYHSAFDAGEHVTIADLETLRAFQQSWEWHHPLADEQLAFTGRNDAIKSVSYYHGGTTLYEFAEIPGVWHESCLRDPTLTGDYARRNPEAATTAGDYYTITVDRRGGLPVVVVRDPLDPAPLIAEGFWEGRMLDAPRGNDGFGYNPIFLVPAYGVSASQLDVEVRARVSHRAIALATLREKLARRL